jgi:hypothetical protein
MKAQMRPYKLRPCKTEAGRIRQGKRICNANSKALEEMMKSPREFPVDVGQDPCHTTILEGIRFCVSEEPCSAISRLPSKDGSSS